MNLGKDASTFKYYTMYGLQEGFEPFAVNMNREVTMWFSKRLPTFVIVPEEHPHIEVRPRSDTGEYSSSTAELDNKSNGHSISQQLRRESSGYDFHDC